MLEKVTERLLTLGYEVKESDKTLINILITKVQSDVKILCNLTDIPIDLEYAMVEMVTGEFLFNMSQSGQLEGFDVDNAIKSIQEGDTTVTFDTKNDTANKFNSLIGYLMNHTKELIKFRRITW